MASSDELDDYDGYEEPVRPKAKVTVLTMLLIVLNAAAALGFVYLLVMDYQKRLEWAYQVKMADFVYSGLNLSQEDEGPSASQVAQVGFRLSSDQLKEAYAKRVGKPLAEEFEAAGFTFIPVPSPDKNGSHDYKDGNWVANPGKGAYTMILADPTRSPRTFIRAKDLTPRMLNDLFDKERLGPKVTTLEEEITRLKDKNPVVKDLETTAAEIAQTAKTDADKRKLIGNLLLAMTTDTFKVEALAQLIATAQQAELDDLAKEAAYRRLLFELLAPLEIAKPGDLEYRLLDRAADIKGLKGVPALPVEDLVNRVNRRLEGAISAKFFPDVHQGKEWEEQKRDSIEKRKSIALVLVALAHLRKPDNSLVFPNFAERAEVVLGLPEYALAVQTYAQTWQTLEEKLLDAIKVDRRGFQTALRGKDGQIVKDKDGRELTIYNQAFLDKHQAEISRMRKLVEKINLAQEGLKIAKEQLAKAKEHYEDRVKHQGEVTSKVVAARQERMRMEEELRGLRAQLFQAQVDLAEAAEINFRLEREIRAQEKGAKAP